MSNVLSVAAANKDELIIQRSGKEYVLKKTGELTEKGKTKVSTKAEAKPILDEALGEAKKLKTELPADVLEFMQKHTKDFASFGADKEVAKELADAMKFAEDINKGFASGATALGSKGLRTRLITNPSTMGFLNKESKEALIKIPDFFGEMGKVSVGYGKLTAALAKTKPDAKELRTILIDHHEYTDELIGAFERNAGVKATDTYINLAKAGIDLTKISDDITKEIGTKTDDLRAALKDIKLQTEEIKTGTANKTDIKEAQKKLADAKKSVNDVLKSDVGHKAAAQIEKNDADLFKEIKEAAPEIHTQLETALKKTGKAAETGAEKSGKGWFYKLFHETEESIEKARTAAVGDIEKTARIEKRAVGDLRTKNVWGAAILGVLAVGTAIYASTGNKGPAENAADVRKSQSMDPSLAGGRA